MQRKFAPVRILHSIFFLCTAAVLLVFGHSAHAAPPKNKTDMTIVIDPGHGGELPGAKGKTAVEKEVVLSVSKKLKAQLAIAYPNMEVVLTRSKDTSIAFDDRGSMPNKLGADLFISIHANASTNKAAIGTETWVMGIDKLDKNMSVAMAENAEVVYEDGYETKYEGFDPNSPESFIMFSFMQNTYMEQSLHFASLVENEFVSHAKRKSRGVKQGPFLVLWRTNMPSVLIEIGFISHADEEKYISSEKGQQEIAEAIVHAIGEYRKRWERDHATAAKQATPSSSNTQQNKSTHEQPQKNQASQAPKNSAAPTTQTPTAKPAASTQAAENRTSYHVQIFSTSRLLRDNAPEFKGLKNVKYYRAGNAYRYYVGSCYNEAEAGKLMRETRKKFPDAFIIKLKNGKPQ